MEQLGVAMDIGTSGLRAQAVDLASGKVISTAISLTHPLPGANVVDHLHFALEVGVSTATQILRQAVRTMVHHLRIPVASIRRLALCGNTVQLSLFQGIEVRDLAYTGTRKLAALGIVAPDRHGIIVNAGTLPGLGVEKHCAVIIPPAVCPTIGADGLAMLLQSDILRETQTALITDYGTNAEMALYHDGRIITASAAAGPAIEGQQIACGMLAAPGAVSDLQPLDASGYRLLVLDEAMQPVQGPVVELERPSAAESTSVLVWGITGTGVVALLSEALRGGHIQLPYIQTPDSRLHLGQKLYFSEEDLQEAGKAIGAIRAGHVTLCHNAGIGYGDVHAVYMAGAAGTYADPVKAMSVGLLPSSAQEVHQVGNTSLKMARELVLAPSRLEAMEQLAEQLRVDHCVLAASDIFKKMYMLELSFWSEGLPMTAYRKLMNRYGIKEFSMKVASPVIQRDEQGERRQWGRLGLQIVADAGQTLSRAIAGCSACSCCVQACPQSALELEGDVDPPLMRLCQSRCAGVACKRCEQVCPEKVMVLSDFFAACPLG
nr:methylamine methyltransferase corrinoid protein reductive activase [uncultured Desulfobulbus sp.]